MKPGNSILTPVVENTVFLPSDAVASIVTVVFCLMALVIWEAIVLFQIMVYSSSSRPVRPVSSGRMKRSPAGLMASWAS